jgi:hypothetical protein
MPDVDKQRQAVAAGQDKQRQAEEAHQQGLRHAEEDHKQGMALKDAETAAKLTPPNNLTPQ